MIPEKLYIPTSTLNFNNLMSSESISPASFYLRRGFGYKRFEKVGPNPLDNRIILYREYPAFEIHDNELENYPMVIEIDSRDVNEDVIKEINGIYFAEETIYFNPFTTKFIFRNNPERISTISKAEPSIETKMVPLYNKNNCFVIYNESKFPKSFNWEKTELEDSKNDISLHISNDRRTNKLKGLLYAYLIASNKSISPEIVALKKLAKTLKNTLSAIITSPDGRATYSQEEQLRTLYKSINERLENIFILPILKEKSEKYQCDFRSILEQENLLEYWLRQNNLSKFQIAPFYAPSKEKDVAFNNYIQNFENQLLEIEYNQKKQSVSANSLPVIENNRISNIPDQKEFIIKLFNEYLEEAYNSDEFIQSRYEFAKSGGKVFKDELGEKWNGSQWQQYINGLLKNLNEYTAFDLKSINNTTLESFAAFCQKGESDIDKLEDYLITNEISDFRIAFSLWGIIFGFANMPKTFTNELFLKEDINYITLVYKHIFKQLLGIELDGKFEKTEDREQPIETKPEVPINRTKKEEAKPTTINSDNQDIRERLKDCKLKLEQLDSICEVYKNNHYLINEKFFSDIGKIRGIGGKTIEKIKRALNYAEIHKEKITQSDLPFQSGDMKPELGKDFYSDSSVWYYIEPLVPEYWRKKVQDEIDWIQKAHQENGYKKKSGEWVELTDHSNSSVIQHFENNSKNRIDQKLLGKIVSKLSELYKINER
jgi:hypothetical protein